MPTVIEIDLNIRVRGNGTYAGFEDVTGPMVLGESVRVVEPESSLSGTGRITEIDPERRLVYLAVEWSSLASDEAWRPAPGARLWSTPQGAREFRQAVRVLGLPPVRSFLAAEPHTHFVQSPSARSNDLEVLVTSR